MTMGLNFKLNKILLNPRSGLLKRQVASPYAWSWNKFWFIKKGDEIATQLHFISQDDRSDDKNVLSATLRKYKQRKGRIREDFTSSKIIRSLDEGTNEALDNTVNEQEKKLIIQILNDILEYKKRREIYKNLCDRSGDYKEYIIKGNIKGNIEKSVELFRLYLTQKESMFKSIGINLSEIYNTLLWLDSQLGTGEVVARSLGWVPVILFFFYSIYQIKTGIPFGALDILASNQHWWNYFLHGFFFGGFAVGALVDAILSSVELYKHWGEATRSEKIKGVAKVTTKWLIAGAMITGVVFSFIHHYSAMNMLTISSHIVGLVPVIFLIGLSLELLINGANLISSIIKCCKAENDDEKAAAYQELFKATRDFAKTAALIFFVIFAMILLSHPVAVLVVAITLAVVSLASMLWDNIFNKSIKDWFKQHIPVFSKKELLIRDEDSAIIEERLKMIIDSKDALKLKKILKPYVGQFLKNNREFYVKYKYPSNNECINYLNNASYDDLKSIQNALDSDQIIPIPYASGSATIQESLPKSYQMVSKNDDDGLIIEDDEISSQNSAFICNGEEYSME